MRDVAVHAAVAEQTQDVERAAVGLGVVHRLDIGGVLEEAAVGYGVGYLGQVLEHDAACADVRVTDLAVAHLAVGQADIEAGCGQPGIGAGFKQLVHDGGLGEPDGVSVIALADAVAVEDNERYRFDSRHTLTPERCR